MFFCSWDLKWVVFRCSTAITSSIFAILELMPRIPHSVLWKAYRKSPLLPLVLRGTRTLQSAINELRWLAEHVQEACSRQSSQVQQQTLLQLCGRRSKGEPLQYILGSQPFGQLDIKCQPGVLIPRYVNLLSRQNYWPNWSSCYCRPETEAYTTYLARLVTSNRLAKVLSQKFVCGEDPLPIQKKLKISKLKILDLCTGSGCIPLLLYSLLWNPTMGLQIFGWDISKDAIGLAKTNWEHNLHLSHMKESQKYEVHFEVVDIFEKDAKLQDLVMKYSGCGNFDDPKIDILISNPPYISEEAFKTETTRSVRNWRRSGQAGCYRECSLW